MSDATFENGREQPWRRRFSPFAIVGMVLGGIALAILLAFLLGWVVMLLWNWLMPEIFRLPRIGYWQAWGLVLLAHILVKPGYGHGEGKHHEKSSRNDRQDWKREFRARFKAGCGEGASSGAGEGEPGADEPSADEPGGEPPRGPDRA